MLDNGAMDASLAAKLLQGKMLMRLLSSICAVALSVLPAAAHEFWILPEAFMVPSGQEIKAEIQVGQDFKGPSYSYIPQNFKRFDLVQGGAVVPVKGVIGDRPALAQAAPGAGLVTVVHQTKDYLLTYKDWETFVAFTEHKDFTWAQGRHLARGLTKDRVRERYIRYAKSLVAVGDGAGQDSEVGLLTEVVALANPYTDDLSGGFPVRILYEGAPRVDVQVEVFAKAADETVEVTKYRTDADGVAVIPVQPGVAYLVDAVVMREIGPDTEDGPTWESLWASLTFKTLE